MLVLVAHDRPEKAIVREKQQACAPLEHDDVMPESLRSEHEHEHEHEDEHESFDIIDPAEFTRSRYNIDRSGSPQSSRNSEKSDPILS